MRPRRPTSRRQTRCARNGRRVLERTRQQRAAAKAAAAESGAVGNTTDAILNDLMMQSGRDVSRIEKNRENGQLETIQQARSSAAEINGQLVAGIADAGMAGYKTYAKYKIDQEADKAERKARGY